MPRSFNNRASESRWRRGHAPAHGLRKSCRRKWLAFEPLEARLVLDAAPFISEFMAANDHTLADQDGDYSDWIEIQNPTSAAVDLAGWHLTDDAAELAKWTFPAVTLPAGAYLVVFASGKDRTNPEGELHTNFQLDITGEYLGLIKPDGATIASQFAPAFPPQRSDVSFGTGVQVLGSPLVASGAAAKTLIPTSEALGQTWTGGQEPFSEAGWTSGNTGVGYDVSGGAGSPQPQAYWNFNDSLNDASGHGHTATNYNAVYSTDLPTALGTGKSLRFNGSSSYVTSLLDVNEQHYTASMWFKANTPSRGLYCVVQNDLGGGGYDRLVYLTGTNIGARVYNNEIISSSGKNYVGNGWHHVVHEYGSEIGGQRIYVDGVLVASGVKAQSDFNWQQRVNIGFANDAASQYFDGWIDDVAVWDTALNVDQIKALAAGASPLALNTFTPQIATNVGTAMRNVNTSAYVRTTFNVATPGDVQSLRLRMKYDDGFVAWLNGAEIARRNAPSPITYNAAATGDRAKAAAIQFEDIELPGAAALLTSGANVLAIQGLNDRLDSTEFLILPELVKTSVQLNLCYLVASTPASGNSSGTVAGGPLVTEVTENPPPPADSANLTITATVAATINPVSQVTLYYRVMFNAEVSLAMRDDGLGGDVVAGDGIYTAVIPSTASSAGQMVRWRVQAKDSLNIVTKAPAFLDALGSAQYYGTVVLNPAVQTQLPVFQWFVQDTAAADTDPGTRCSVFYLNEFYDNVSVRIRGQTARSPPKKAYKFDFNPHEHFRFDAALPRVEEINVNSTYSDKSYVRSFLSWDTFRDAGATGSLSFPLRVQQNGQFFSVAIFVEQPDEEYLDRNGLDPEGALYKLVASGLRGSATSGAEKKTRLDEGFDDLQALYNGLALTGTALANYLYDNIDLAAQINYMATCVIIQDIDRTVKNYYVYRDTNGDREWRMLPWDMDLTFGPDALWTDTIVASGPDVPKGATHPFFGNYQWRFQVDTLWNSLLEDIIATPSTREMFVRRLRTLADQFLGTQYYENKINQYVAKLNADVLLDKARWGTNGNFNPGTSYTLQQANDRIKNEYLAPRRTHLFVNHNINNTSYPNNAGIPNAQSATTNPTINFGTIEFAPASGNQDEEYFQLVNPNAVAVDISGWHLTGGVEATFPGGTVIPAGGTLYLSPSVAAFRARTTGPRGGMGLFVQSYQGHLSSFGETINLAGANGATVNSVTYVGNPSGPQQFLRITEVNFNPLAADTARGELNVDNNEFEYIELLNAGTEGLNLSGVHFVQGVTYTFAATVLQPGEYGLLVKNEAAFESRYGTGLNILGMYTGSLNNGGESVKLDDALGGTINEFSYQVGGAWPGRTAGKGSSLEVVSTSGDYTEANNWRASADYGGSPGRAGTLPEADVVINEVLSHTDKPLADAVELYNTSSAPVDMTGWYLSDSDTDYLKFRIPEGTVIAPYSYLVFYEGHWEGDTLAFATNTAGQYVEFGGGAKGFGLNSAHGDDLYLVTTSGDRPQRFADHAGFGAAANGESLGRWHDDQGSTHLYPMLHRTLDAPNNHNVTDGNGPRVGPLVISEVMYAPKLLSPSEQAAGFTNQEDMEFIEIYNPTTATVDLTNWHLDKGVAYDFAPGTSLAPGQRLVVVPFDPANTAMLNAFRGTTSPVSAGRYNSPTATVVGPYSGHLSNAGDRVQLQRPDAPPPDELTWYPPLLEDEVVYSAAWGASAADGKSLHRIATDAWGDNQSSWAAATASLGAVRLVTGRYVFYNNSAFDGRTAGADALDDGSIAPDKRPLLPGRQATFDNYTSYSRGINGILIDVAGLAANTTLTASDFVFQVWDGSSWVAAPAPTTIAKTRTAPAPLTGMGRVTLIWADGAIANQWLQVTVKATTATGLAGPDVFYFGNAMGETGNHRTSPDADAAVDQTDEAEVRTRMTTSVPAPINSPYDFNHDRRINATDEILARANYRVGVNALPLLDLTGPGQAAAAASVGQVADLPAIAAAEVVGQVSNLPSLSAAAADSAVRVVAAAGSPEYSVSSADAMRPSNNDSPLPLAGEATTAWCPGVRAVAGELRSDSSTAAVVPASTLPVKPRSQVDAAGKIPRLRPRTAHDAVLSAVRHDTDSAADVAVIWQQLLDVSQQQTANAASQDKRARNGWPNDAAMEVWALPPV